MVCFEHFEDDRFKRKNKSELKAGAIPTIIKPIESIEPAAPAVVDFGGNGTESEFVEEIEVAEHVEHMNMVSSDCTFNQTIATIGTIATAISPISTEDQSDFNSQCKACIQKDFLINKQSDEIRELRQKLKKANNKIWYLKNTKEKLDTAFSELQKQQLLNEELCNALEVIKQTITYKLIII